MFLYKCSELLKIGFFFCYKIRNCVVIINVKKKKDKIILIQIKFIIFNGCEI